MHSMGTITPTVATTIRTAFFRRCAMDCLDEDSDFFLFDLDDLAGFCVLLDADTEAFEPSDD